MIVYVKLFAGMTANGNARRAMIVKECRQNGAELVKVIRYCLAGIDIPDGCLYAGEFNVSPRELNEYIKRARSLNILEYEA